MRAFLKLSIISILLSSVFSFASASNLPRSKEATLIESTSPTEVMVRAKGIGCWEKGMSKKKDRENFLLNSAENDARKAAVYFIIYGGSDPLLTSDSEKSALAKIEEDFFRLDKIRNFIFLEGQELPSRTKRTIKKNKNEERQNEQ